MKKTEVHKNVNLKDKWFVVDENNKVIEKFRHSYAAHSFIRDNKKLYYDKLRILSKEKLLGSSIG